MDVDDECAVECECEVDEIVGGVAGVSERYRGGSVYCHLQVVDVRN